MTVPFPETGPVVLIDWSCSRTELNRKSSARIARARRQPPCPSSLTTPAFSRGSMTETGRLEDLMCGFAQCALCGIARNTRGGGPHATLNQRWIDFILQVRAGGTRVLARRACSTGGKSGLQGQGRWITSRRSDPTPAPQRTNRRWPVRETSVECAGSGKGETVG